MAENLIDGFARHTNSADLIEVYARPLTIGTTGKLLGVSEDHGTELLALCESLTTPGDADEQVQQRRRLRQLLHKTASADTHEGGLLYDILLPTHSDGALSPDEATDLVLAVYAGGRTPVALLASAFLVLLGDRAALTELREDPDIWRTAPDELLRFIPVGLSGGFSRLAASDTSVGGCPVRSGDAVLPATISANFDEDVFGRDAGRLNLRRTDNPHLAFGFGVHRCPGAPISRILVEVAIKAILEKIPNIGLSGSSQVVWHSGLTIRALAELPVEW
ncbi:cytochrome P450 [Streptomyces sp. NPDC002659]|uniref:cytochrome P450 n=1 Tax=Streptomyces sp. NPDC002659 TaxID=3364656 RepID=UPI0036AB2551